MSVPELPRARGTVAWSAVTTTGAALGFLLVAGWWVMVLPAGGEGLPGVVGALGVVLLVLAVVYVVTGRPGDVLDRRPAYGGPAGRVAWLALPVVVLPAVAHGLTTAGAAAAVALEEVLFRGAPVALLAASRFAGSRRALVLTGGATAVAFALAHGEQSAAVAANRLGYGVGLFVLAWCARSLLAPVVVHLASNTLWGALPAEVPLAVAHTLDAVLLAAAVTLALLVARRRADLPTARPASGTGTPPEATAPQRAATSAPGR
ncbi:CPBP family intramembrane metalloprotease [Cellulomonas sp. JZ18]|uniref:CPBP family intramembrane glutamic endopeptidase n=1 Tax=Cellulomonas sp. JZ18 TaxID=2654191 RepID=UPI0012D3D831|nr:CPBP family intramembrane glutamic endopeptidase [Cellulomonas sp. JZ18]QGQ19722.1 CPBP family intramembrane metalloprotease [Cellulomonas sp. JZ18]